MEEDTILEPNDFDDDESEELEGPQSIQIELKQYITSPNQDKVPYKPQDFDHGPNTWYNRYSTLRNFFFVGYDNKNIIVWHDY